jgi:hypothetical protein
MFGVKYFPNYDSLESKAKIDAKATASQVKEAKEEAKKAFNT